jgi:GNAT superfamily N-acetyltransferase
MPDFWDYNAVRVEGPVPDLRAPALLTAAEELQAGLPHRRVEVEEPGDGARLRDAFAEAGWVAERLLWMRREGPPPAPDPDQPAIEEVAFAATRALRARWHRGDTWSGDDAAVERFLALEELVAERRRPRAFAARAEDGRLVGFVSLWAPQGTDAAEVEQAFVAPEQRGGGLGGQLVAAAVRHAERPVQWIVADDEGRPKHLYARLGFRPAWLQHGFVRRPRLRDRTAG